ncbi:MAG: hypothetical protein HYX96_09405 [Chloroflexi bacterium]|nr:hypothetical protein [Chloroflexota bacterium]
MIAARRRLTRARMLAFLEELASKRAPGGRTAYFPPSSGDPGPDAPPELASLIAESGTGAVMYLDPAGGFLVVPPFPVKVPGSCGGWETGLLGDMLRREHTLALALVRLGSFAVGVARGEELVASKVGTGLVHARHRQGGSSATRFRRHREKQIEYFLTRVCEHAREKLEPYERAIDYIIYGGAWTTILTLQKQCPYLKRFEGRSLPPLLDIPDPRLPVLENAVTRAWSSEIITWRPDEAPVDAENYRRG